MVADMFLPAHVHWFSEELALYIQHWLRPIKESPTLPQMVGDPAIAEANKKVVRVQERKRKHVQYHSYDPGFHIKIAKYACEKGNKSRPSLVLLFLRQQL